ncbi:MAG: 5'/3'-nucleotidase SurE [Pseudomonadota bacterium]|nr:5'/3'-nucleotidase SurE [Pseudomonadota bacterium]
MSKFLLSNDDGVDAGGLAAAVAVMREFGEVLVVAPRWEQSGMSSAITKSVPLLLHRITADTYALQGTPSDCVKFAIYELLAGKTPQLLVSGINHGANLGQDTIYSGTVAAAIEGALHGIPAIAVSIVGLPPYKFATAAAALRHVVVNYASHIKVGKVLNINVPNVDIDQIKGYRSATLGVRSYERRFHRASNPRSLPYFWLGWYRSDKLSDGNAGSDCSLVDDGYVAMTMLNPSFSDDEDTQALQKLLDSSP